MKRLATLLMVLSLAMPLTILAADDLKETAREVAKRNNGKVLSAKTINRNQQRTHEVKVLTDDGRVRTVRVPERGSERSDRSRSDRSRRDRRRDDPDR